MKSNSSTLKRVTILIICFLSITFLVMYFGTKFRLFGSPFTTKIDWILGLQEQSYKFDVVIPGKLYRSKNPDREFIHYLQKKYGIRHIITLNGKKHRAAKKLGMDIILYHWSTSHLPPKEELKSMVDFIDKNDRTLIHCAAGSDRTGYAVASYRMWRQNWTLDAAIKEMEKYGYHPEKKKALQQEMKAMFKENDS